MNKRKNQVVNQNKPFSSNRYSQGMFIPSAGQDQTLTIGEQNLKILDRLQNVTPNREFVKAMEPPKTQALKHVKTNWKRMQQEEDKLTEIERENRILLQKMKKIYCKSTTNNQKLAEHHRQASKSISEHSLYAGAQSNFSQGGSILVKQNQHQRKLLKEKEKIEMENQQMLKRLQNKRSNYNIDQWQKEEESRQMILRRVSVMPRNSSATEIAAEASSGPYLPRNESYQSGGSSVKTSQRAHYQIEKAKHLRKQLHFTEQSISNSKGHCRPMDLEPGRIVLYKKALLIEHIYYICEISYNKRGFFISLFSVEFSDQNMTLHLKNSDRTDRILKSYSHDFDRIAHALVVRNGRICLPHSSQHSELSTLDPIFEYDKKQDLKSHKKLIARENAEKRERQLPPSLSHYHQIIKKNVSLNELENVQFKQKLKRAKYANQRETRVAEGGPRDLLPDRFGYFKAQHQSTENMPALIREVIESQEHPSRVSLDGSLTRSSKASKIRRDRENQILLSHLTQHEAKSSNSKLRHRQDSKLRLKNRAQQIANITRGSSHRNNPLRSDRSLHKTEQRRHLHADSLVEMNFDGYRVHDSQEGPDNQSCLDILVGTNGGSSLRQSTESGKPQVLASSHYDQDQSYDRERGPNNAYDSREYQQMQTRDDDSKFSKNQYRSVDKIRSLEQNEIYTDLRKRSKNAAKFKVIPDDCPSKPLFFYNHHESQQQSSPGISIQNQLQRAGVDRYASVETYFGASLDQVNSLHADGKRNHPSALSSKSGNNLQSFALIGGNKNYEERGLIKSTSKQSLNNGIYFQDGTQVKMRPRKIVQKQSMADKRNSENVFERLSKPSAFQLEQNAKYQKERQQKTKAPTKNSSPKRMPPISKATIERDSEQRPKIVLGAAKESLRRLKQPEAESEETDFNPHLNISLTNETKQQIMNQKAKLQTSHLPKRSIGGQRKSNAMTPTRRNDEVLVNLSLKKGDEPAIEDNYSGFAGQSRLGRATAEKYQEAEQQYRDFKPYNYYENSQDSRRQKEAQNLDNIDHLSQDPNSQTSVYRDTHESGFPAFRKQSYRGAQSTYNHQQSRIFDQVKHAIQPPSMLDEIKREVSEYSMSQKNFLMKQRKRMGVRNTEADATSTVNRGSDDRSPSVQSILNTEEQEKMNRTGQFSVEPSQLDNQQNSFYTDGGNSKTISNNNKEAKILYDLNEISAKTMIKRNPTDLTAKSSHSRTNEDELNRENLDKVASKIQLQNELKKNYGIKSNIHIHLQTKDNTNTATNSESRDHEAFKQFRDSTQKNADALYESNNEDEESKDVVVSQIHVDDHLANLDRKRGSNERNDDRQRTFQRTESQPLNTSQGSLLNLRNQGHQLEQSRKSIITMGQIGAKTKRDLSTNRDDNIQSPKEPIEETVIKMQDPASQPRTLKATVSGRLEIPDLDNSDYQEQGKGTRQYPSQLSSIRMISASKEEAKPYEEDGRNEHALVLARLNNNSSSNSMEESAGLLRSPETRDPRKQHRLNQASNHEQDSRMVDSSAQFILQQNSSHQDEFHTFNKDHLLQGGTIGNSTVDQREEQDNDYAQNLYSPLSKKHGRSQMYDQELVTDNARGMAKQRNQLGQQIKISGINSHRIEVKNGLNMYHQRHLQPTNPALRGLIHQSSEVNSSLMTNKTAGFGQPVYESVETFGQNHTNGGNSIQSKQSIKPSLITDPHRAKSSLDMSEFSFQEKVQANINTANSKGSGLRFKKSNDHSQSRDLNNKSNSVSHQPMLLRNISVPGSSRAPQSPSFVVGTQQNTTDHRHLQEQQNSLMLIENSNSDYVEQPRPTKPYAALVHQSAQVARMPAGDRLQFERVQREFDQFVKDDLDIIDDDDFKVIQQILNQETPAQPPQQDPSKRENQDLAIIEENPENNSIATMKGSQVLSPPIEEQISADSQDDKYSDEEYEVIEEAEDLQQSQQEEVKWTNRSSNQNQNHIRDQIQAMDDDTSFNSDLQMAKPGIVSNGEHQVAVDDMPAQPIRQLKQSSPIDQRALTQQAFNKPDHNNNLFESNRNYIQQVNNLDSVKSKDSYSLDFTTEKNESKVVNPQKPTLAAKPESSRDDHEFSDVPSQQASQLNYQRNNTKSSVVASNQTFERASSRDQFTQSQLGGDLGKRKSSQKIN